ncbi:hypothetical protein K466DRAFT_566885 [Polyporus arcularius HHB13444]|uniref:Uncharacterized protein n=1 Tax=Polyporus arcularius HHB13444 TaxID=1314778 RepID=A0A5C3P7Q9_9APHY|nr:hypothetical protein K466DRAFT_566885 [Polyporus arcularius HHB13444]
MDPTRFRHFNIYSVTNNHPDIPFNQGLKALSASAALAISVEFIAIARSQDGKRLIDVRLTDYEQLDLAVVEYTFCSAQQMASHHHNVTFPTHHIRYGRRPACAIFPIVAVRVAYGSGHAVWLVHEQPCDPVCVHMDICIMPETPQGTESIRGTIQALSLVEHDWALFELQTNGALIVLCVPKGWADVDCGISTRSRITHYWRPAWLLQISPEIFTMVFNMIRGGMLHKRDSDSDDRSSAETIRPSTPRPQNGRATFFMIHRYAQCSRAFRCFLFWPSLPVSILRPSISWYGPRFAVAGYPPVPVALGRPFQLEVRYLDRRDGTIRYAVDTGIRGTVFAIESVSTDSIEFVLCNDGPGHPYCYIIVPHRRPHFVSLPYEVEFACWLLRPYVYCTYWSEDNHRPPVEDYSDDHTRSPSWSVLARTQHIEAQPTGLVANDEEACNFPSSPRTNLEPDLALYGHVEPSAPAP